MIEREFEDEIVETLKERPVSMQRLSHMAKKERDEYEATHDMERDRKIAPRKFDKTVRWK